MYFRYPADYILLIEPIPKPGGGGPHQRNRSRSEGTYQNGVSVGIIGARRYTIYVRARLRDKGFEPRKKSGR